jgi:hypothetical protein
MSIKVRKKDICQMKWETKIWTADHTSYWFEHNAFWVFKETLKCVSRFFIGYKREKAVVKFTEKLSYKLITHLYTSYKVSPSQF